MQWNAVSGVTKYRVRRAPTSLNCVLPPCLAWKEYPVISSVSNAKTVSTTLADLGEDGFYHIQIQAVRGTGSNERVSAWSETVYTLTTKRSDPPSAGTTVGIIPLYGYRPSKSYSYAICTEVGPKKVKELEPYTNPSLGVTTDFLWKKMIVTGLELWETATDGMVTVTKASEEKCSSSTIPDQIRLRNQSIIKSFCNRADAGACVIPTLAVISYSWIFISEDVDLTTPSVTKSGLFRTSLHEGGHVFGLGHATKVNQSVMNMPAENLYAPTSYDVVAIKATYQSR